ncbi:MAG: hypothetical protein ACOYB1_11735 [Limnohabitans sp.]
MSINTYAQIQPNDPRISKIANYISSTAKIVGGANQLGVRSVSMNWVENNEIKEIKGYYAKKRIGALMQLVEYEKQIEEKTFPKFAKDQDQLAITLMVRLFSYAKYATLVGDTTNDLVMKDFFDSEVTDIKLVFDHKIHYQQYLKMRETRVDKFMSILFQDTEIGTEFFTFVTVKNNSVQSLANKTVTISLSEACVQNIDLCVKLSGK